MVSRQVRRWLWLAAPLLLFAVVDQTEGIKRHGRITLYEPEEAFKKLPQWKKQGKLVALSPTLRAALTKAPGEYRVRETSLTGEPEYFLVPYVRIENGQRKVYWALAPWSEMERMIQEQSKLGAGRDSAGDDVVLNKPCLRGIVARG